MRKIKDDACHHVEISLYSFFLDLESKNSCNFIFR